MNTFRACFQDTHIRRHSFPHFKGTKNFMKKKGRVGRVRPFIKRENFLPAPLSTDLKTLTDGLAHPKIGYETDSPP